MKVIGLMSGTSHDGIDVVGAELTSQDDTLVARIRYSGERELPPPVRAALRLILPPARVGLEQVCRLDVALGELFAEAALVAIDRVGGADLVCSHGQTVFHDVASDGAVLGTLQLGAPAVIAERTGLPVVSDLRSADIAAGGQGAPLVAMMDEWLLAGVGARPVAVNLGGIANITVPAAAGRAAAAYDIGPGNALMDAAVYERSGGGAAYDRDGVLAAAGQVDATLVERLLAEPFYQRRPPKSTGKELFHPGYVAGFTGSSAAGLDTADLLATLLELTARTVADEVRVAGADVAAFAGGGLCNPALMGRLMALLPDTRLCSFADLGVDPGAKEALLVAVLGWCTWTGRPGARPALTGAAHATLLGSVTPGRDGRWPYPHDPTRRPIRRMLVD